jgi:hypothetical protein
VRHDLIAEPALAICQGVNAGHTAPYLDINYPNQIERAKRAGAWETPVLEIPVPAPDKDERIAATIGRYKALAEQVVAERAAGALVNKDRVVALAKVMEVAPFELADEAPKGGEIFEYHITNKIVAPDQVLARLGLPPLPNGMGSPERLAEERAAGGDETGALAKVEASETKEEAAPGDEEPAPEATRNPPVGEPPAEPEPKTQRSRP